eukprot:COSAG02_NODE_13108_length_1445_cov_1.323180_2_plen_167_part_00
MPDASLWEKGVRVGEYGIPRSFAVIKVPSSYRDAEGQCAVTKWYGIPKLHRRFSVFIIMKKKWGRKEQGNGNRTQGRPSEKDNCDTATLPTGPSAASNRRRAAESYVYKSKVYENSQTRNAKKTRLPRTADRPCWRPPAGPGVVAFRATMGLKTEGGTATARALEL